MVITFTFKRGRDIIATVKSAEWDARVSDMDDLFQLEMKMNAIPGIRVHITTDSPKQEAQRGIESTNA